MDKVKEFLAVACLAYERGDVEFAIKSFMSGMDEATSCGDLKQVVEFLRPPIAPRNADVPAAENTMSPALHSDNVTADQTAEPVTGTPLPIAAEQPAPESEVKSPVVETPVEPQPVVAPIPEPVPSTITSLSTALVDDGDEELEARAEAEDEIDDDEDLDDEDDEDDDESDEEDEDGMKLSISSSTPLRLKQG